MPQRYGDFATWTGSIGTVAAFAIAYYQIHQERRHRLAREFKDRVAARREHADKISAWVSGSTVVVANGSGHPIHDVDVTLGTLRAKGGAQAKGDTSTEGDAHAADDTSADHGTHAAGDRTTAVHLVVVPPGEHSAPVDDPGAHPHVLQLAFTDSRADRWSRKAGKPPERLGS